MFALDYIEETAENYAQLMQSPEKSVLEAGEIQWAYDVLTAYFACTDETQPLIGRMKTLFQSLPKPEGMDASVKLIPYESKERAKFKTPSYEQFLELSKKRRSVRWFQDKQVPRETCGQSPASRRAGAQRLRTARPSNTASSTIRQMVKEIANIPFGTSGYADNMPMVVVVVGDLSDYFSPRDRHTIYVDAALSVMSFMYALETLGLSSVGIQWPDFGLLESKMKKELNLKAYERPVIVIGVGYAKDEGKIPCSKKKPLDEMRSYNDLGTPS